MAPRTYKRRTYRKWALKRYKAPSSNQYFRCKIDIITQIKKNESNSVYDWEVGSNWVSSIYSVNNNLIANDNFKNYCKQFSYVRIKGISYTASPDTRNQTLYSSGYVGISVWPRGAIEMTSTDQWVKSADNPFFKILNSTRTTYKYCNLLGGDNEWKATSGDRFCWISMVAITNTNASVSTADAPQWMIKMSLYCVFKSPIQ